MKANDLNKEAKRIISHSNTGKECNYMGVDFLYYGMGIYGYSEDVVASGCEYKKGNNDLFLHIVPTVENVAKYLHFIRERM